MEADSLSDPDLTLYAAADIHGKPQRINTLKQVARRFNPNAIVLAGDITQYMGWKSTRDQLSQLEFPVFFIRGNSDFKSAARGLASLPGFTRLSNAPSLVNGIPLKGANGTLPFPLASRIGFREAQTLSQLAPGTDAGTILVAHPPPRGTLDRVGGKFSAGSHGLARLIQVTHPMVVICGHIHEQAGWAFRGNTLVVNCAMGNDCAGALIRIKKTGTLGIRLLKHDDDDGKEIRLTL